MTHDSAAGNPGETRVIGRIENAPQSTEVRSIGQKCKMTTRHATKRKEHALYMRLPDADIAIIDRAARMRGRSRTDFVREAAVRAAEDVLLGSTLVRMSPSGFNAFMRTLAEPAAAVPEMVELFKRSAPWKARCARK